MIIQVIIMIEAAGAASNTLQYPPLDQGNPPLEKKTNRDQLVSAKFSQRTLLAVAPLTLVNIVTFTALLGRPMCVRDEYQIWDVEKTSKKICNIASKSWGWRGGVSPILRSSKKSSQNLFVLVSNSVFLFPSVPLCIMRSSSYLTFPFAIFCICDIFRLIGFSIIVPWWSPFRVIFRAYKWNMRLFI